MCSTVACAMRDGDCDILTQGDTSLSIEETLEGVVFGVSCTAVLFNCSFP